MKVLCLEPWDGGSHRSFLDEWSNHSRHHWTRLGLPPRRWKWRMRHSALTLAEEVESRLSAGESWDLLLCSDMLDLATFRGLVPGLEVEATVVYFHENQLTYPVREEAERDLHFAFTNFTTALAADAVWFNSDFHRREFLGALEDFLGRMPDHRPQGAVEAIEVKSQIEPPGILPPPSGGRSLGDGPLHLLWAARWEFDKDPETFFQALFQLQDLGVHFRLSVLGESFRQSPQIFSVARERLAHHIVRWGYEASRDDYQRALAEAEVVVSTARHEFFGIGMVEAMAAGCRPLLPRRLAYPELLSGVPSGEVEEFFYEGESAELARRLVRLADSREEGRLWPGPEDRCSAEMARFFWPGRAREMDDGLEALAEGRGERRS